MTDERAIEILSPEHREHYESIEPVNEACRIGIAAIKRVKVLEAENAALRERLEKAIETPCEDGDVFYRFFWHPNEMVEDMACGFRKEKDGEIYVCSAYSESWYNIKDCEFSLKAAKARLKRMQKKLQGD